MPPDEHQEFIPPGWYQDPTESGSLRFWNGHNWTLHKAPARDTVVAAHQRAAELATEVGRGRWATRALIPGSALCVVGYFMMIPSYSKAADILRGNYPPTPPPDHGFLTPETLVGMSIIAEDILGAAIICVGVIFLSWFYQAARVAKAGGIPSRRSPGWAIGGFFIPVVNLWFPFRSAANLVPAEAPSQRLVWRWWALWVSANLAALAGSIWALWSVPMALILMIIASAFNIGAAHSGRSLIDTVNRTHASLST